MMEPVRPLDPRLLRQGRSARRFVAATVVAGFVTALVVLAQAAVLSQAVVRVFQGRMSPADLGPWVAAGLAVFGARALVGWLQEVAAARASSQVKGELRAHLLGHSAQLGPVWWSGQRRGELTVLLTRGLDALDGYFGRYLPQLFLSVLVPVAVIAVLVVVDPASALIVVVTLPLIPVFMVLIGWTTQRQQDRQWRALEQLSGYFLDLVAGLATLKVFGRARAQEANLHSITDQYRTRTMSVLRLSFVSSLVLELVAMISVALIAVFIGVRLVAGDLTLSVGLFVLMVAPEAYLPLRQVGAQFHASQEGLSALQRAYEVLDEPLPRRGLRPAPDLRSSTIRVTKLRVDFPGRDLPAVDGLSMVVRPGEVVALVGPSGSGKSTLLSVLSGQLVQTAGSVDVDVPVVGRPARRPTRAAQPNGADPMGAGPVGTGPVSTTVPLADIDPASWCRQVAVLPQRPAFVSGTIADNVRLVAPDVTDDQVRQALEQSGAWEFVVDLPGQLDSEVGEQGAGLSVGQRQRVGLARVFVRDPALVLLDEPTASLDGVTEAAVVAAIRRLAVGRTVLVVAHRPALVALADRTVHIPLVETVTAR
jgi:ATP-binding cassette subfamily C protein CydCD